MVWKRAAALLCAALMMLAAIPAYAAQPSPLHVLLIGVDASAPGTRGRSDTMMLVRIDPARGSVHLVSFLRDLYVPIPGVGKTRLNAAYAHGGEALLRQTLEACFDVPIDRTVTVGFSLLCELVDEVGGVDVEIEARELKALNRMIREYNADYGLSGGELTQAGLQHLDGRQALCYSRLRKIDSDFQRTSRQQALIAGLFQRLSSLRRWELIRLAVRCLNRVETDLSLGDLLSLLPLLQGADSLRLSSLHIPDTGCFQEETIRGMQVLVPDLPRCRARLSSFLKQE